MNSSKITFDSSLTSPTSPYGKPSGYTDDDLDRFQRELHRDKVIEIWKKMREGGNSKDGIVTKDKFRQIFLEHFHHIKIKESLVNAIFERFRKRDFHREERYDKRRIDEKRNISLSDWDRGEIDLHDLAVSLAILSPLNYEDKLELVFDLTDIDEDGCLSPDDICKMFLVIERNFSKESSFIDSENASSLYNVATKKALRRFNYLFLYEGQEEASNNSQGKARKDKLLGHFKDFMEKLNNKQTLLKNLLPKHYSIKRVLNNQMKEMSFHIHKNEEEAFKRFRSELHGKLWRNTDAEIKYKAATNKRDDLLKYQLKEPGDLASYGIKTIDEEAKVIEYPVETFNQKHYLAQEKNSSPEHKKRLKEMRERELPNLGIIIGNQYQKLMKKRDNSLPPIGKITNNQEAKCPVIEMPDLNSMVEKRVERLKKQYKHLDPNYKDFLLNKLTSSKNADHEKPNPHARKIKAYKFLL